MECTPLSNTPQGKVGSGFQPNSLLGVRDGLRRTRIGVLRLTRCPHVDGFGISTGFRFGICPQIAALTTMLLGTFMLAREVLLFHTLRPMSLQGRGPLSSGFHCANDRSSNERDDVNILRRLLDRRKRSRCSASADGMDNGESPMKISIMPAGPTAVWPAVGRSFCIDNFRVRALFLIIQLPKCDISYEYSFPER
jgi:hypothetical protein